MRIDLPDDLAKLVDSEAAQSSVTFTPLARTLLVLALHAQLEEQGAAWRQAPRTEVFSRARSVGGGFFQDPELLKARERKTPVRFNNTLHLLAKHGASGFPKNPND